MYVTKTLQNYCITKNIRKLLCQKITIVYTIFNQNHHKITYMYYGCDVGEGVVVRG